MNHDGTGLRRITNTAACEVYPTWSPDGNQIVFVPDEDPNCNGTDNDIYVAQANGSNERRLTNTPARIEYYSAWSPEGDLIAFDGCPSGGACQVYTVNPDGSGQHPLTSVGSKLDARLAAVRASASTSTSTSTSTSSSAAPTTSTASASTASATSATSATASDPLHRSESARAAPRSGKAEDPTAALRGWRSAPRSLEALHARPRDQAVAAARSG
jgi:Tol biopolymer transport system component